MALRQVVPSYTSSILTFGPVEHAPFAGISLGFSPDFPSREIYFKHPWSVAGRITNLRIVLGEAPGTGKSVSFALKLNGAYSAMGMTISNDNTIGLSSVEIVIAPGDILGFERSYNTAPSSAYPVWVTWEFIPTNSRQSGFASAAGITSLNPTIHYANLMNSGITTSTTLSHVYSLIGQPGTMTRYDVYFPTAPSAKVFTCHLVKNGVVQDGAGGTVDTEIVVTGSAKQGFKSFSIPVVVGDTIAAQVVCDVATTNGFSASCAFEATDLEKYYIGGVRGTPLANSGVQYTGPSGLLYDSNEEEAYVLIGVSPVNIKGLIVKLQNAPGGITTRTFIVRKNFEDTPITLTLTGSTATDSTTVTDAVVFETGDKLSLKSALTGTPLGGTLTWSLAIVPEPAPVVPPDGIFLLTPGSRHDEYNGGISVAIPTPSFTTSYLGD